METKTQFGPDLIAMMRSVLDDCCRGVPLVQSEVHVEVAVAILETARAGERSLDAIRSAANRALASCGERRPDVGC